MGIATARRPRVSRSRDDALTRRCLAELAVFTGWLTTHGRQGYVGEFGIPYTKDPQWIALLDAWYRAALAAGLWTSQWASGNAWPADHEPNLHVNTGSSVINQSHATTVPLLRYQGTNNGTALAGFEFPVAGGGGAPDPGWTLTHTDTDIAYLQARGVRQVRLGMMWERMQPTLGGALLAARLTDLDATLQACQNRGVGVVLDLHNYCRYTQAGPTTLTMVRTGGTLNAAHLADFWTRLSTWVRADADRSAAVVGYGLMNEPHDLAAEAGAYTQNTVRYTFDATDQGWGIEGGAALTYDTVLKDSGAGSVNTSAAFGAGFTQLRLRENANSLRDWSAQGNTLRCRVFVPSGGTGTFAARWGRYNAAYTQLSADGSDVPLTKGAWTTVDGVFSGGTLATVQDLLLMVNGQGINATVQVNVDTVEQGPTTAGLTAAQVWEACAQAVVTAIRAGGDARTLLVAGYEWSHTHNWATLHPAPFVTDPDNNHRYEAHHYWDVAGSGRAGTFPASYATELARAVTDGY